MIVASQSAESKQAALDYVKEQIRRRHIADPNQLEMIAGHDVFLGIHQVSRRRPFYFTFMRDPIDRFLSNFRYLKDCAENPRSPVQGFAKQMLYDRGFPIPLEQVVQQRRMANMMTHYLAAAVNPELNSARWDIQDEEQLLRMARYAVEQLGFVGFYDQLETDGWAICRQVGVPFRRRPVNRTRSRESPIDDDLREKIRGINEMDYEVYDWARAQQARRK